MSLYHKYRPSSLDQVVGNSEVVSSLTALLGKEEKPHSFLLTGPTGCGKTTIGRIIANVLEAGEDFIELDSATTSGGVDSIRSIRERSQFTPMSGKVRVWMIDECHTLTSQAQEALLKLLEDTPSHVYIILCTTDPQKLRPTLRGRCSIFNLSTLSSGQMIKLIKRVLEQEEEELETPVIKQIVKDTMGHPRNALQLLEQVLSVDPENRLEAAQKPAIIERESIELCRLLVNGDASWHKVRELLKGLKGEDAESIRRHVLGYIQSVLLNGTNDQAGLVLEQFIDPFYNSGFPGLVLACYSVVRG